MNRILNRNLAATLLAAIVMTIIAPPAWAQAPSTQILGNHRAFVTAVTGTVEVKVAGQQNWVRAAANREVKTGDKIRTAANSKCRIKVSDVGEFEVTASSEVAVGNLQQIKTTARAFFMFQRTITRDDVGMDLRGGDMRSSFSRNEGRVGNYNVYTPVAVAGVRGTKFELDLEGGRPWYERLEEGKGEGDENSLTTIVLEGEVEVQGGTWTRSVVAGQQLRSTAGNSGTPTDADPNRLQELMGTFISAADKVAPTFDGAQSAERAADGAITVAWNAASDDSSPVNAIVYDLFEATSSRAQDLMAPAAVSNPGITSLVIRGLDAAAAHYFIVRARDEAGNRDANTKEVAVVVEGVTDQSGPSFSGATSVSRLSGTEAKVEWYAASDDQSAPDQIAYDVYAARNSGQQDYSKVTAISDSGATSITLTGLTEGIDYYIVVRARDAAGNRDANTEEVTTYVERDDYDTNAVMIANTKLIFEKLNREEGQSIMDLLSSSWVGLDYYGQTLNYSTIYEVLNADFSTITTADYEVTSAIPSNYGQERFGLTVTWNGRIRFSQSDTELPLSGQTSTMVWEGRPLLLTNWEGASPIGVRPENVLPTGLSPSITDVSGIPDLTFFDCYQDFGPYRVVITGANFIDGARVFMMDAAGWTEASTPDVGYSGSVFYQSPNELFVDVALDKHQWMPGTLSTENLSVYVQNPDGKSSDIFELSRSVTPGPISISNAYPDRPFEDVPSASPYNITVEGCNIVGPISQTSIKLSQQGQANPNFVVDPNSINLSSNGEGQPLRLTFNATITGDGLPAGSYDLTVDDARGEQALFTFTVVRSNQMPTNLTADYTIPSGQTVSVSNTTIGGNGYRIIVDGTLNASGVTFNNAGIVFNSASAVGILQNSTVQGVTSATFGGSGISVNDGNVSITGGSLSSNSAHGIAVMGGNVTLNGTTLSSNGTAGAEVTGGSLSLSGVNSSSNAVGLSINGAVTVNVSGGSFSSNSSHNIYASGGCNLNVGGGTQINNSGSEGLLISGASNVGIANATFSGNANQGIHMDGGSAACNLALSSVTISGSPIGIQADAGTVALNGSANVAGNSIAGIELRNASNLTTSGGSNIISGNGLGTNSALKLDASFGGSASITNTTVKSALLGIMVRGGGTLTLSGSSAIVENCQNGIDVATSSCAISLSGGVVVRNNGGYGLLIADCGSCSLNNVDVLNNTSYGVARPSGVPAGSVALFNVLLQGNNGQGGNDPNTSPPTPTSSQYQNLINPPNTVQSPR